MAKRDPIPPIRVGSRAVTYTPPGPDDITRYNRLVFGCELLAMRRDGAAIFEEDACCRKGNLRGDIRLPDGTEALDVPYGNATPDSDGSSWSRPYITSIRAR